MLVALSSILVFAVNLVAFFLEGWVLPLAGNGVSGCTRLDYSKLDDASTPPPIHCRTAYSLEIFLLLPLLLVSTQLLVFCRKRKLLFLWLNKVKRWVKWLLGFCFSSIKLSNQMEDTTHRVSETGYMLRESIG